MPNPLTALLALEGVGAAVAAARDSVDVVLRDRGSRRVAPEQAAALLLAGARASADLTADPARWLPGAVRLAGELPDLSGTVRTAPAQALARAHTLAAAGAGVPAEALGRLRADPATAARLAALVDLLRRPVEGSGLVLAAVAHAEVAVLAPFGSGDDLVARALERMVLRTSGVDPEGLLPVEAGHRALPYAEALAGYAGGGVAGVRGWLVHCCRAATAAAEVAAAQLGGPVRRAADRPSR